MFDEVEGVGFRLVYCVDGMGPGIEEGRSDFVAGYLTWLFLSIASRVLCLGRGFIAVTPFS
jgi:hypothetical protein